MNSVTPRTHTHIHHIDTHPKQMNNGTSAKLRQVNTQNENIFSH